MDKSESIKELATALAKAQGELENAGKTSVNPHFKSRYADLAEVLNTVRPVMAKHGLSVTQWPSYDGQLASVETMLMHVSGEWMASVASAPLSKLDAQGIGSATTYLRRYSLAAICGIAQEDDDANGAKPAQNVSKAKPPLTPDNAAAWQRAKEAFARDGNLKKVMEHMTITSEFQDQLMREVSGG